MITLGQADFEVAANLPPARGRFAGWDWQTFYNAILHVLQNPTSQGAYYRAYGMIDNLPEAMRFTPQILTAGWARFTSLYPGWEQWQYRSAYDTMYLFAEQSGRLVEGDESQWWTVEREWQAMEVPEFGFIPFASGRAVGLGY